MDSILTQNRSETEVITLSNNRGGTTAPRVPPANNHLLVGYVGHCVGSTNNWKSSAGSLAAWIYGEGRVMQLQNLYNIIIATLQQKGKKKKLGGDTMVFDSENDRGADVQMFISKTGNAVWIRRDRGGLQPRRTAEYHKLLTMCREVEGTWW